MSSGITEVDQPSLRENYKFFTIWKCHLINLRFYFFPFIILQIIYLNFIIEVSNITNNCTVFHFSHMVLGDDVFITCCSYKYICILTCIVHSDNLITFHCCLKCTNRINLCYLNSCTRSS